MLSKLTILKASYIKLNDMNIKYVNYTQSIIRQLTKRYEC